MTPELANRLIARAFRKARVVGLECLTGGLRNANFKVTLSERDEPVVLRIYQQDPSACQKEVDLLRLLHETVPAPEVLHAEPNGLDEIGPFAVLRYVEGITFRELKRTGDLNAIQQASRSVGGTLAAIGRHTFSDAGRICAGLKIGERYVDGPDPVPRMFDSFIASPIFQVRAGKTLAQSVHELAWQWAPRLASLDEECHLVHSDFGSQNILVRCVNHEWVVAAVLDWEFAFSGTPLLDVGHFLRYERQSQPLREPYFSQAFLQFGGKLPDDWRQLGRVIDLTALCEILTRENVAEDIVAEVLDLVQATVEDCAPKLIGLELQRKL